MGQIIELPEMKELKEEIHKLKDLLNDLLLQRDELILVICENIKTEYMLEFGTLEYKLYEVYCKYLRLRRKRDLIQSRVNSQKSIRLEAIEQQLDLEFQEYKDKLKEKMDEVSKSIQRSQLDYLSDEDTAELKGFYRTIVKSLHPDLNPKVTEEEIKLLHQAHIAYKNGDLKTIRILFQMVDSREIDLGENSSLKTLIADKEKMQRMVEQLEKELEIIRSSAPYTWKIYLDDNERKNERKEDLKDRLLSFQQAVRTQEEYISKMMRT